MLDGALSRRSMALQAIASTVLHHNRGCVSSVVSFNTALTVSSVITMDHGIGFDFNMLMPCQLVGLQEADMGILTDISMFTLGHNTMVDACRQQSD